jgi:hypothetical protein
MAEERTTMLLRSDELGAWQRFPQPFAVMSELGRTGLLILALAGVVLGLAACEPKPPKPKVFFTHERSML